jgi:glycerol kinase
MTETSAKKDVQKLQRTVVDALEDVKAQELVVFDTEHLSSLFERVIVASGTSNRQTKALAASVQSSDDVFLVPAFAGLGAPDWDGKARGTLVGLTRGTGRAHIARAALEAIALQTADVFDAMASDSGLALTELRVEGGASRNDLLMQIQANVLGVPVVRSRVIETTALGAAYLAGLATGYWSGVEEISSQWQAERRFEPEWDPALRRRFRARLGRDGTWARLAGRDDRFWERIADRSGAHR